MATWRERDTLWSFGWNNDGQLGDGTATGRSSPIQVGSLTNWAEVACGFYHSVTRRTDGTLWTFGQNSSGQLGDGTATGRSSPVQVGTLTNWADVAGGGYHSIAIQSI